MALLLQRAEEEVDSAGARPSLAPVPGSPVERGSWGWGEKEEAADWEEETRWGLGEERTQGIGGRDWRWRLGEGFHPL